MEKAKIIFAGTPSLAIPTLNALINSKHEVCAVYTQPDRPAGRGLAISKSPVKQLAERFNLPIEQPTTLKSEEVQHQLKSYSADLMIVIAYGFILPEAVLRIPRLGCINIHASLLPRFRGAAPIQKAILEGDIETGVSIMQMDKGMDTGPVYLRAICPIMPSDTTETLQERLAELGAQTLLSSLDQILEGQLIPKEQDHEKATYAKKIEKNEAQIDWTKDAKSIERAIRAFNPWPIAFTYLNEHRLRIWKAEVLPEQHDNNPGIIIRATKEGIDIATGHETLRILKLQFPGGKILSSEQTLASKSNLLKQGECFN